MVKNLIFSIFFFSGIIIISIVFLPAFFLPQKIVLFGGKLMGHWTSFCLKNFLSTKIVIKGKENIINNIGYEIHHIQYRSFEQIVPYINVYNNKRWELNNKKIPTQPLISDLETNLLTQYKMIYSIDWNKPQYKYTTNFLIKADLQNDIYHLFAYGTKKKIIYYNVAFIPDYKTSVMMNEIFRNIRENKNIDYIEESEDEEDFENITFDKHVNIHKSVPFECIYSRKFKKWIPVSKIKEDNKIVHIGKLVRNYIR